MSTAPPIRVLVVDDNAHVRALIREVLASMGMEVREATDGAMALNTMKQWRPDVAMVDYEMQPMNGATFTRMVRQNPALRNLPILMMTAHGDAARVMEARDAGINGLIAKPLSIGSIVDRLEKVLSRAGRNDVRHAA